MTPPKNFCGPHTGATEGLDLEAIRNRYLDATFGGAEWHDVKDSLHDVPVLLAEVARLRAQQPTPAHEDAFKAGVAWGRLMSEPTPAHAGEPVAWMVEESGGVGARRKPFLTRFAAEDAAKISRIAGLHATVRPLYLGASEPASQRETEGQAIEGWAAEGDDAEWYFSRTPFPVGWKAKPATLILPTDTEGQA